MVDRDLAYEYRLDEEDTNLGVGNNLVYGEVLEYGVTKLMEDLDASNATSFHDVGMGCGRLILQVFLQYKNIKRCLGIELTKKRFKFAEENIQSLLDSNLPNRKFDLEIHTEGKYMKIKEIIKNEKNQGILNFSNFFFFYVFFWNI